MESIIKQVLNGKVTCIVPCGEDLRMLKHILYQIKLGISTFSCLEENPKHTLVW